MRRPAGLLLLALALAPVPAAAQGAATLAGGDSLIALVPLRPEAEIQAELDDARRDQRSAEGSVRLAEDLRSRAKARLDINKQDVQSIEARIKLARQEKDEARRVSLEAERARMRRDRELLEKREEMRSTEISTAKDAAELAKASIRALEAELALVGARGAWLDAVASADSSRALGGPARIQEAEKRTLEAQRERWRRTADLASAQAKLTERRLALQKAQIQARGR